MIIKKIIKGNFSLPKLKDNKIVFIGDLEHSNPLLTQIKSHGIIKVQISKIWGISR